MALAGQLKRLGKHSVDLRPRRARLADPRRPPAAALHALPLARPTTARSRRCRARRPCSTIVLRFGISTAFFRFYFDAAGPGAPRLVLRTSFWFTMTMATPGSSRASLLAPEISHLLFGNARRREPRPRRVRRALGADELRAADVAVPRRGALGGVRAREPRRTSSSPSARRCSSSSCSTRGRSASSSATSSARSPSTSRCSATGASSSGSSSTGRCCGEMNRFGLPLVPSALLPLGDELQRPLLPRQAHRHRRGRPLLGRRPHRLGDGAAADGVPHGLAGVRLLDRERRRGEGRRTPSCSRTSSSSRRWIATALALLSPWLVDWLTKPTSRARRASSARSRSRPSPSPGTS